jgi:DNA-binding HxlR family transcriptional regulator
MHDREQEKQRNRAKACMFKYGDQMVCVDPSLPLFSVLGKKDSILIIGVIGNRSGKNNFNEIVADIPESSSTLISKRIKELIGLNIISRNKTDAGLTYSLTAFGESIRNALLPFLKLLESQT